MKCSGKLRNTSDSTEGGTCHWRGGREDTKWKTWKGGNSKDLEVNLAPQLVTCAHQRNYVPLGGVLNTDESTFSNGAQIAEAGQFAASFCTSQIFNFLLAPLSFFPSSSPSATFFPLYTFQKSVKIIMILDCWRSDLITSNCNSN